ncbi:MAG: restriction endonuclease subunit S, partial [Desulfitobacteriaceae bacterium]|nr:restriction endonuclease subunit S [Desulfitobacteriaceae bacterium]
TTFMELSSYDLNNLVVEVPNKKSQRKIANFLDLKTVQFDSIISKKELLIQKLEEAKKSLISEVVTGKVKIVDGEMIPREFDEIRDCGIKGWGMVPDVWQETKVKYELTNYDHLRIPLSSEVRGSMIEKQYDYYGASGVIDKVDSFLFDGKYVLVGEDGANLYSRSTALAYIAEGQFWVNNHAHILKAKNYNDDYYCFILENLDYTVYITGAAQPKLTQDRLANIVLYVAGYHEQCLIQDSLRSKLSKIVNCIEMYSRQIDLLKQAKQSLISEAVTGKIDLRNWEITEEGELQ